MSWQEELRRLDQELAAGRISADDYRLRRDEVLSSAVDATAQSASPPSSQSEATQVVAPVDNGGAASDRQSGLPSDGQTSQAGIDPGGVEPTQVAHQGWQAQPPGNQGGDAERTQVVPPVPVPPTASSYPAPGGQPPQSGGFPVQQPNQYNWNAPHPDPGPPWGGSDFPPLTAPASTEWAGQGPEGFEEKSSGGKKIAAIVVSVVLVAALGVGSWLLFFNGSDDGDDRANPPTQTTSDPAPTSPPPPDDLEIAQLPGTAGMRTEITTFDDVVAMKALTEDENEVYEEAGAGKARMAVTQLRSGVEAVILTVETSSQDQAATAVDELVELQEKYGMESYDGALPSGVHGTQIDKSEEYPAAARAHYVHGKTVVRIQVSAPDQSELGPRFEEIVAAQLQALSAND